MGGIEDKLILLLSTNQWQYLIYFEFFFFLQNYLFGTDCMLLVMRLIVFSVDFNEINCFYVFTN